MTEDEFLRKIELDLMINAKAESRNGINTWNKVASINYSHPG